MNVNLTVRPLPATNQELAGFRQLKIKRNLNDQVEDVVVALWEIEDFQALLYAVRDSQAVEGSLSADNIMAAKMIRERANKLGYAEVATQKLASISSSLNVVLRRYKQSRAERRDTVHGVLVHAEKHG